MICSKVLTVISILLLVTMPISKAEQRRRSKRRCSKRKLEEAARAAKAARLADEVTESLRIINAKEQQRQKYIDEGRCDIKDPHEYEPEGGAFRTIEEVKTERRSYTNFENDIYEALELFHVNAGPMFEFADMDKLKQEIREQTLTEEEQQDLEKRVCEKRRIGEPGTGNIYTCASCGVRDPYDLQYYSSI